jgi:CheY-like chemotaxis protein
MSPEQALDSTTVDARADIYSLGASLYFLLAGQPPYKASSIMALLLKHRDAPIPSLCEARNDVPAQLDAIYRRMVAKNPADRFAGLSEVIASLENLNRTTVLSDLRPEAPKSASESTTDQTTVLPATPLTESGLASPASLTSPSRVVVLVEPSRTQAGIIRRFLEQLGISTIHMARNGREALDLARRERADVIVSGMHLADMTGVQLAQTMLADASCTGTGFVLATSSSEADESALQLAGARVALMPKPFDLQRLEAALSTLKCQS